MPMTDTDLGTALLERFTTGVASGEWRVISLGTLSDAAARRRLADDLGVDDPDRLVILVAVTPATHQEQ